jgi:hypothetical protein
MERILFWLCAVLVLLTGSRPPIAAPGHTMLAGDLSQLRSRFNADAGKVRAIFLATPT